MKIPPKYRLTRKISALLAQIEANKEVIDNAEIPLEVEENIRRESLLGSALFSARIEGNTLTRGEVSSFSDLSSRDKKRREIANLHRAISFVLERANSGKSIACRDILLLHRMAMKNILARQFSGKFRTGHEGVFDSQGNIIYHSPPPGMIRDLTDQLLKFAGSRREEFVPVRAVLTHLVLEYIHPFVDGSGRVGRLLQLDILNRGGYGMKGLVVVEELIDKNRQAYYRAIENGINRGDATEFIELMLSFLAESSATARNLIREKQKNYSPLDLLPPRRREIVEIIRDQRMVSLDFLHRRFLKVSPRLLSYDLKKLREEGYLSKIGKTRGALYTVKYRL